MTIADDINRMILKIVESLEITSANPTHTNTVIQANELEQPDLEQAIRDSLEEGSSDNTELEKVNKKIKDIEEDIDDLEKRQTDRQRLPRNLRNLIMAR